MDDLYGVMLCDIYFTRYEYQCHKNDKNGKNGNFVIIFTKMSIFWGVADASIHDLILKSQCQFFSNENTFVSVSVINVFFSVISKVSGAIARMDIYKMSIFWEVS